MEQGLYASELLLRAQLAKAIRERVWLKLSVAVSVSQAHSIVAENRPFTADVAICQAGREPGERSHYCYTHDLYYGA